MNMNPPHEPDLLGQSPAAARATLVQWLSTQGETAYRVRQILPRLWERPVGAWDEATDLPVGVRLALEQAFPLSRLELAAHQVSRDGTEKFLWTLSDGQAVESVLIPEG